MEITMTSMTYVPELRAVASTLAPSDMCVARGARRNRGAAVLGTDQGTRVSAFGATFGVVFGASAVPASQVSHKSIVVLPQTVPTGDVAGALGISSFRSLSPPV